MGIVILNRKNDDKKDKDVEMTSVESDISLQDERRSPSVREDGGQSPNVGEEREEMQALDGTDTSERCAPTVTI